MHVNYAFIWSALAVAAEAVACAPATFQTGNAFIFTERSGGIWQADFTGGSLRYTPNTNPSQQGFLDLSNETSERKVMCVGPQEAKDWECWWLNAGDTCETTVLLNTTIPASVGTA